MGSRAVIAFRVDDAQAIPVENERLAEQAGHPRLARLGIAGDEHVAPSNGERELAAILHIAEQETTPRSCRNRQSATVGERAHVGGNCRWA